MKSTSSFMVGRIRETYKISLAIDKMKKDVFIGIDKAIRKSYKDWLGADWTISNRDDGCLSVVPFRFINPTGSHEYIRLTYQVDEEKYEKNDDDIWGLFGLPTPQDDAGAYICIEGDRQVIAELNNTLEWHPEKLDLHKKDEGEGPYYCKKYILPWKQLSRVLKTTIGKRR